MCARTVHRIRFQRFARNLDMLEIARARTIGHRCVPRPRIWSRVEEERFRHFALAAPVRDAYGWIMAEGLNRVILLGNLGADPELKVTQGGTAVLKLRLATTERYVDRGGAKQERTEWHSVLLWGKRGEALHKYLAKGSRILVERSLRTSTYDDRDGNKRYRTEVVASNVVFAGGTGGGGGRDRGGYVEEDYGPPPSPSVSVSAPAGAADPPDFPNDDDIPF